MKRKKTSDFASRRKKFRDLACQLGSSEAQSIWGAQAKKVLIDGAKRHEQLLARSREASIRRRDKIRSSAHHY